MSGLNFSASKQNSFDLSEIAKSVDFHGLVSIVSNPEFGKKELLSVLEKGDCHVLPSLFCLLHDRRPDLLSFETLFATVGRRNQRSSSSFLSAVWSYAPASKRIRLTLQRLVGEGESGFISPGQIPHIGSCAANSDSYENIPFLLAALPGHLDSAVEGQDTLDLYLKKDFSFFDRLAEKKTTDLLYYKSAMRLLFFDGIPLLELASLARDKDFVFFLLDQGIVPNSGTYSNIDSLWIYRSEREVLIRLLRAGGNANFEKYKGWKACPLYKAIREKDDELCRLLMKDAFLVSIFLRKFSQKEDIESLRYMFSLGCRPHIFIMCNLLKSSKPETFRFLSSMREELEIGSWIDLNQILLEGISLEDH